MRGHKYISMNEPDISSKVLRVSPKVIYFRIIKIYDIGH